MVCLGARWSSASPSALSRSGTVTPPSFRTADGARAAARISCWSGPASPLASGRLAGAGAGEVDEAELADLHLVAAGERGDVDRLAIDVGAVEAADVVDGEAAALAVELHVPAADRHVVEEDVAVGVPAGRRDVLVEQEPAAGVGAALHHEQGGTGRQRLDGTRVGVGRRLGDLRLLAGVLTADLGDDARRLADPLLGEGRTALRAEATALGVLVATSSAVHVASPPVRWPAVGLERAAGGRRATDRVARRRSAVAAGAADRGSWNQPVGPRVNRTVRVRIVATPAAHRGADVLGRS